MPFIRIPNRIYCISLYILQQYQLPVVNQPKTWNIPTKIDGNTINGEAYEAGSTGAPVLESCSAYVECKLIQTVEKGDHSVFIGEVVDAGVKKEPTGRPDDLTLTLKDVGDKIFYGG